MTVGRELLTAMGVAAACAVLGGCGGSGGGGGSTSKTAPSPRPAGEATKTPKQILADVSAALGSVRSYHADGTETDKDGRLHLVADISVSGAARFTIDTAGRTAHMVVAGRRTYIKANRAFWVSQGGPSGAKVAKLLSDRWVKVPGSASRSLTKTLDKLQPRTLAYCLTQSTGTVTKAGTASVAGRQVVVLADKGDRPGKSPGRLYVAASGPALPLRQLQTGPQRPGSTNARCDDPTSTTTRSDVRLSAFNRPLHITAPRGALDLSRLSGTGGATAS
jgi:hypothetical protein